MRDNWLDAVQIIKTLTTRRTGQNSARTLSDGKPEDYFGDIGDDDNDSTLMSLVTSLIEERSKPWNPNMVRDPVQEKLLEIIEDKRKPPRRSRRSRVLAKSLPTPAT
ncbi:hypothetical protein [Sinorhizobium psoraleae]|uniref:Uncharacterized protein n=1 Tax=Sinorhizobium psoraleae TaxID=520838 RepID=A0ABT4KR15_9HYPH|nr:hypothetical protein [Sinorhizobium psoraleae]MCZ4093327.1 hypothetical protein [Sinorhizobium psoraleae]